MLTIMNPTIDITMNLRETVDADGVYRRILDERNLPPLQVGQCLQLVIGLGESVQSGVSLARVMLSFPGESPLQDAFGRPVSEVTFPIDDETATWVSPPLERAGDYGSLITVELKDDDSAVAVAGNHVATAWPQMVIDDNPPT